jgi:hypothetical protein
MVEDSKDSGGTEWNVKRTREEYQRRGELKRFKGEETTGRGSAEMTMISRPNS